MISWILAGLAIGMILGIVLVFLVADRAERDDARRIQRYIDEQYEELPWTDPQLVRLAEDVRRGETSVPEE